MKKVIIALSLAIGFTSCQSEEDKLYAEYEQLSDAYVAHLDTIESQIGKIDTTLIEMQMRLEAIERELASKQ